jgi:hypothetical protein
MENERLLLPHFVSVDDAAYDQHVVAGLHDLLELALDRYNGVG